MQWYERFGYQKDPFLEDKPIVVEEMLEDIIYYLRSGSMIFVEGAEGAGKTELLQLLIDKFKGKKKVIFVDATQIKTIHVENLMHGRHGLLGKALNILPRDMLLFIDNVQDLSRRNTEKLKFYFDNDYIHSVIFTGSSYKSSKLSESIKDRIGAKVFYLPSFNEQRAIDMVKSCLSSSSFFPESKIREVYATSPDLTSFLASCSRICEAAVNAEAEKIDATHLEVLRLA